MANAPPKKEATPRLVRGRQGVATPIPAKVNTSTMATKQLRVTPSSRRESHSLDTEKVQNFMKMTQLAMEILMREQGFSWPRAQRALLDHLVRFQLPDTSPVTDTEVMFLVHYRLREF